MEFMLQELCALAMHITGSLRVKILRIEPNNGVVRFLSEVGRRPKTIDIKYSFKGLGAGRPTVFIQDIRRLPEFDNHPAFERIPNLTNLAIYYIMDDAEGSIFLSICNPRREFFQDDLALASVERIVNLARSLLQRAEGEDQSRGGLHDSAALHDPERDRPMQLNLSEGSEPASRFLLETLLHKPRLLERNGCSYLPLRMWRKPIKAHQLAALIALKMSPPPSVVDKIAAEIAATVKQTYGNTFQTIVPVPGGSSGRDNAFSVLLGKSVSNQLGISFANALLGSDRVGSSHPKKSSKLKPFVLREQVGGNVLIIDDVATSGRHIELATLALRSSCEFCTAVVWISD
jgi:hypothetical protein